MNSNGQNRNNTFAGNVLIDGNLNITGNLTVDGTYPGGGGGGSVNNPMTEDLDAGEYKINNLSEISGLNFITSSGSAIIISGLDLQQNLITNVNTITVDNIVDTTYGVGQINCQSDLNMNGKNILNVESLSATYVDTDNINPKSGTHVDVLGDLDLNSHGLRRVDKIICRTTANPSVDLKLDLVPATLGSANQVLARDPLFNPAGAGHPKTVWLDAVLNPMTSNLDVNGYSLTNILGIGATNGGVANINLNGDIKSTVGNYISGITNLIGYSGTINIQGDVKITDSLDMSTKNINRVEVLDTNYIESKINNIVRFSSVAHMLNNLVVFGDIVLDYKSIFNVERITASHASVDLNLDMIPATQGTANQVLARDPAFNPANPATHKLVWQTPSGGGGGVTNPMSVDLDGGGFNINNVETISCNYVDTNNIVPKTGSSILVSGDINLNSNGILRCDRITGYTTAIPSVDLKLDLIPATQGTANQVLARDPAFNPSNSSTYKLVWQTISGVTNPLSSDIQGAQYSMFDMKTLECKNINIMTGGGGLSSMNGALQVPITWGLALKLSSDPFYRTFNTDYITPASSAGVTIDSKLQDGKTDSKITLSSPSIIINNSTNPTPSAIEINGNIQITNTAGHIQGDSLILRGRTSGGVSTPLYIESSISYMSNKLFVLTDRSPSIGVRTTLFKTFGPMPNVNINSLTPVKLNTIIANQKGDNIIPAGGFVNGDKFIIIMNGLLTSVGSGSLTIYLYVGTVPALQFSITNVASTGQPCKITMDVDCTVAGNNVNLSNGTALLSFERFNTSIRYSTVIFSSLVDNTGLSNSFDIYVAQSATQVSNFTPISYTIEQL
jgi:hypothetical protein